ncbi:MAG TPA: hypothetical protein VIM11_13700, partial [Tepidisphaeraceae bacterium]
MRIVTDSVPVFPASILAGAAGLSCTGDAEANGATWLTGDADKNRRLSKGVAVFRGITPRLPNKPWPARCHRAP